jgi:hypothetical protein
MIFWACLLLGLVILNSVPTAIKEHDWNELVLCALLIFQQVTLLLWRNLALELKEELAANDLHRKSE